MIHQIEGLPSNMVGFRAEGDITEEDFEYTVIPNVDELVRKTGKLNYLLILDTDLDNYTWGAWLKEAWMGLKNFFRWNRAAIITDNESTLKFVNDFSKVMLGSFKGFKRDQVQLAIDWASGKVN
ncbi:MAG: hypothetical protein K0S12_2442 [Bacteroidetes bacterium]|jgi:hypothetical protein|nr:hypothetical protein [Bacteroidota bacterium]